jgi:biopolymer transport protein ExbB
VRELLASGRYPDAEAVCRQHPSFLSFVLLHGIAEVDGGWTAVQQALEDATSEQSARLLRKIEYLAVIGNLAPMIGLLGTVVGMIIAFQQVASTQGAAGAAELAEGIYQALVTTVGGLIVAIPSLAAFAFFRNRVDQYVAEIAYAALHACNPLKRRAGAPAVRPVAPPRRRAATGDSTASPASRPRTPAAKERDASESGGPHADPASRPHTPPAGEHDAHD